MVVHNPCVTTAKRRRISGSSAARVRQMGALSTAHPQEPCAPGRYTALLEPQRGAEKTQRYLHGSEL